MYCSRTSSSSAGERSAGVGSAGVALTGVAELVGDIIIEALRA